MKVLFGCVVLAVIVCATAFGQGQSTPSIGSLETLTTEVRLLRMAVEKSTQTQAQLQGLSVYLSAQQSRLIQTSARVDTIRKDLDIAVRDSKALADRIAALRENLAKESNPELTARWQDMLTDLTREAARGAAYQTQIRAREAESFTELQTELARWSDLIARLEQTMK
jgi:chromosome segregation ATPase